MWIKSFMVLFDLEKMIFYMESGSTGTLILQNGIIQYTPMYRPRFKDWAFNIGVY